MLQVLDGVKVCVNCRHHVVRDAAHICVEPHQSRLDLVTGIRYGVTCREMRNPNGQCGEGGDLFARKEFPAYYP